MLGRDVQRVEVEPVAFHLRPLGHGESHVGEDRGQFLGHLADGMDRALPPRPRGQRHVQPLGPQPLVQGRVGQRRLLRRQRRVDLVLQRVQPRARRLPLLGRHPAEFAHLKADLALLAHRGHAKLFQRGLVGHARDQVQVFLPQIVHHRPPRVRGVS
jgi:hypothetical protein